MVELSTLFSMILWVLWHSTHSKHTSFNSIFYDSPFRSQTQCSLSLSFQLYFLWFANSEDKKRLQSIQPFNSIFYDSSSRGQHKTYMGTQLSTLFSMIQNTPTSIPKVATNTTFNSIFYDSCIALLVLRMCRSLSFQLYFLWFYSLLHLNSPIRYPFNSIFYDSQNLADFYNCVDSLSFQLYFLLFQNTA